MATVQISIEHYMYVAEVVKRLKENGVPMDDLFVEVRPGEAELRDPTGSYGVRRFTVAAAGLGQPQ